MTKAIHSTVSGNVRPKLSKSAGLTLMELMITLAIVGLTLSMVSPLAVEMIANNEARQLKERIQQTLSFGRQYAIDASTTVTITPIRDNWNNGWEIRDGAVLVRRKGSLNDDFTIADNGLITSTYTVSDPVEFDPSGQLQLPGQFVVQVPNCAGPNVFELEYLALGQLIARTRQCPNR